MPNENLETQKYHLLDKAAIPKKGSAHYLALSQNL